MRRPPLRERLAFAFRGARLDPVYHPWAEHQLTRTWPVRVMFGAVVLLWTTCIAAAFTGDFRSTSLASPALLTFSLVLARRRQRDPAQMDRTRRYLGLPPYDGLPPMPRRDALRPFTTGSLVITVVGIVVLALGVGEVVARKTADDRCRTASPAAVAAVQALLVKRLPPGFPDVPELTAGSVADRHPHLVAARAVDLGVEGFQLVAGYVEYDGGVRGPALWEVTDPSAFPDLPPELSRDLVASAKNSAAHAVTPLGGFSSDPLGPRQEKALDCAREAR